jgi:hypothetical protein
MAAQNLQQQKHQYYVTTETVVCTIQPELASETPHQVCIILSRVGSTHRADSVTSRDKAIMKAMKNVIFWAVTPC